MSQIADSANKPRIGVDLDDTVVEFVEGLRVWHNRVYGGAHEQKDFTTWQFHEIWGCEQGDVHRRVIEFYGTPEHQEITAISGSQDALRALKDNYELIAITARGVEYAPRMLEIINRYFSDVFADVHFIGIGKTKGAHCVEIGVTLMIDDALHNAQSVGEQGIPVLLMNQPWNQGELPINTTRVMGWKEVVEFLQKTQQQ